MADPNVVVALVSGWVAVKGESVLVREGDLYAANHPIVRTYPMFFGPQIVHTVEQATAAPGETRTTKRGA